VTLSLFVIALVLAIGVLAYSALVAPANLRLTLVDVLIDDLPPEFDEYRIAILTDLHHGPQQPRARAKRAVDYANSQAPDLTVLLGDYGTSERALKGNSRRAYQAMFDVLGAELRRLRAPDGIIAVLGNHDFYAGADDTAAWLRSLGARVLRNEVIELRRGDAVLRIAGIDDLVAGRVSRGTVETLVRGEVPTIVLSHHPDAVAYCAHPSVRLVLSGHTHGGQIVLPWIGAPVTRAHVTTRRAPAGWVPNEFAPLFVSRGIGVQIPIRFRCPPEVVVVALRRRPQHPV
jgi:predicted MPP superfamily phosphohydrolase